MRICSVVAVSLLIVLAGCGRPDTPPRSHDELGKFERTREVSNAFAAVVELGEKRMPEEELKDRVFNCVQPARESIDLMRLAGMFASASWPGYGEDKDFDRLLDEGFWVCVWELSGRVDHDA